MSTRLSQYCDRIIEAGWLAAAAIVPVFFNAFGHRIFEMPKVAMLRSLVVVMVLAWAVKAVEGSFRRDIAWRRWLARPLMLPTLCLALVYLVATALSVAPAVSFWGLYERVQGTVTTLSYVVLFFLVASHLRTREQFHRLVSVSLAVSLLISAYGIMQHFGTDPVSWSADISGRVIGTMGNPIFLAAYLIMAVPFTLARLVAALRRFLGEGGRRPTGQLLWAAAYVLTLVVQLVAILFTNSRGPWLGLLVALAVPAILLPLRLRLWRTLGAAAGATAAVGLFFVLINIPGGPLEGVKARSSYLERLGSLSSEEGSVRGRLLMLRGDATASGIMGLITSNPARTVIGYGPETLFFTFGPFLPAELTQSGGAPSTPGRSHSDLLDHLVTTGVLGVAAFLAVLFSFYWSSIRYLWRTADLYEQLFGIALVAAVTGHLVETFVGIAVTATQTQFWLYLGAMAALVSTGWQAAPRPGGAVASAGAVQRKKRKKGPARRQDVRRRRSSLALYLLIFYVLASFIIALVLVQGMKPNWPPATAVTTGFLWVVLGLVMAAACLRREGAPLPLWRPRRWWLHLLLLGGAVLALTVLLRPVVADMLFKVGEVSTARQQYQNGVRAQLAAISYTPDEAYYYLVLGRTYMGMAQGAPPGGRDGLATMGDLFAVGRWTDLGRDDLLDAGLVALEKATRLNGLRTDNWTNLAELHRSRAAAALDGEDKRQEVELATQAYLRAVKLAPNASYVHYGLATAYREQGQIGLAIAELETAVKLASSADRASLEEKLSEWKSKDAD